MSFFNEMERRFLDPDVKNPTDYISSDDDEDYKAECGKKSWRDNIYCEEYEECKIGGRKND